MSGQVIPLLYWGEMKESYGMENVTLHENSRLPRVHTEVKDVSMQIGLSVEYLILDDTSEWC